MNYESCVMVDVKGVNLEIDFSWTPIIRATREQPEEGGIEEITAVYCEGVDIIDLISGEVIDELFEYAYDYIMGE